MSHRFKFISHGMSASSPSAFRPEKESVVVAAVDPPLVSEWVADWMVPVGSYRPDYFPVSFYLSLKIYLLDFD